MKFRIPFFTKRNLPPLSEADEAVRQNYLRHFDQQPSSKTPLRELRFVVLDTETSGIDYKKDQLLSIAAILVENFQAQIGERFEAFFHRPDFEPGESIEIHGILRRRLADGTPEKEVLRQLLPFLRNSIIVGHHVSFDISILNQALQRHFQLKLKNRKLDTGWLARRLENPNQTGANPASLDTLCKQYNIPLGKRHTAAGDTFITALLFLKLIGRLERRKVERFGELFR